MITTNCNANSEAEVRKIIDDRIKAVCNKDVNASMSNLAPGILSFDVVDPLQKIGSDALRKRAEEWFSSFQGPIVYEIRDLGITAGDDVAFSHGLSHVSATKSDGGPLDMWWRSTVCFRKTAGKWMVTHEHNSVSFNVESGKASLDLKP
jgi:ketosteroid isomerase-like protein